jgi:hypothetical protein
MLEGVDVPGPALLSLRGRFAGTDRVVIEENHVHPHGLRDLCRAVPHRGLLDQGSGPAIPKNGGWDDVTIVATALHKL